MLVMWVNRVDDPILEDGGGLLSSTGIGSFLGGLPFTPLTLAQGEQGKDQNNSETFHDDDKLMSMQHCGSFIGDFLLCKRTRVTRLAKK